MFFLIALVTIYFEFPIVSFQQYHSQIRILSVLLTFCSIQLSYLTFSALRKARVLPHLELTQRFERLLNPISYFLGGALLITSFFPLKLYLLLSPIVLLLIALLFDLLSFRLCTLYRFSRRNFWLQRYDQQWKKIESVSDLNQAQGLIDLLLFTLKELLEKDDYQGSIDWIRQTKVSTASMIQSFNDRIVSQEERTQIASFLAVKLSKMFSSSSLIQTLEKHESALIEVINFYQQLTISLSTLAVDVSHIPLQESILFAESISGNYAKQVEAALACVFEHLSGAFIHNPYMLGTEKSVNLKIIIEWLRGYGERALERDIHADIGPYIAPFEKMVKELKEVQKGPVELLSIIDQIEEALLFFNQLKLSQTQRQDYEGYIANSGMHSDTPSTPE